MLYQFALGLITNLDLKPRLRAHYIYHFIADTAYIYYRGNSSGRYMYSKIQ
jgi:hypothetical protein